MSVLADVSIREQIAARRIVLDPFEPANIQPASVDVRLGAEFRVHRNWKASHIDPFEPNLDLMEAMTIAEDEAFVLHPGEFALGHTLERLTLPDDLVAQVNGKSSLGRIGLQVHSTAGWVDPGWSGQIVLEFSNVSRLPIKLRPRMRVAQFVFLRMDRPVERGYGHPDLNSKYQGQQGAQASKYDLNR
ncbi:MAG TPA: dCTP deaminase [Acidimicrobiales bacterium]